MFSFESIPKSNVDAVEHLIATDGLIYETIVAAYCAQGSGLSTAEIFDRLPALHSVASVLSSTADAAQGNYVSERTLIDAAKTLFSLYRFKSTTWQSRLDFIRRLLKPALPVDSLMGNPYALIYVVRGLVIELWRSDESKSKFLVETRNEPITRSNPFGVERTALEYMQAFHLYYKATDLSNQKLYYAAANIAYAAHPMFVTARQHNLMTVYVGDGVAAEEPGVIVSSDMLLENVRVNNIPHGRYSPLHVFPLVTTKDAADAVKDYLSYDNADVVEVSQS